MNIHWIDISILGVLFVSFLLSFRKGFICEAFALGSIFLSFIIANQFDSVAAPQLSSVFSNKLVSEIAAFIVIFIISVFLLRLTGKLVQDKLMKDSAPLNILNRVGGGILGVAKGLLVLMVVLVPVMNIPPLKNYIDENSEYAYLVENSAIILSNLSSGDSVVEKVRDENLGMFGGIREKTKSIYKDVAENVKETGNAIVESKPVEAIKEAVQEAPKELKEAAKPETKEPPKETPKEPAKETVKEKPKETAQTPPKPAKQHKDAITPKDQNELDQLLGNIEN